MKNVKRKRIIIAILIIIWAIMVFYFSNQSSDDSSSSSFNVTSFFIKNEELAEKIEPYVRKIAHYCEYELGGMLFALLILTYELSDKKTILFSTLLGVWYASMDEVHQALVPGRAGRLIDVYIDSLGVATGVVLILIINKVVLIIKNRKK